LVGARLAREGVIPVDIIIDWDDAFAGKG